MKLYCQIRLLQEVSPPDITNGSVPHPHACCMHASVHTHTHTHTNKQTNMHAHMQPHTDIHQWTDGQMDRRNHIHTLTFMHEHMHVHACMHTHALTHTHTESESHTESLTSLAEV